MSVNIKTKMEEIKNKIQSDKNFADEFADAPVETVQNFFGVSADDADIISNCILSDMKGSDDSRVINPSHVGYYYSTNGTSFIHIEKTENGAKTTFYQVTVGGYTNMCGITDDNLSISGGKFAVNIPSGKWYYIQNGVKKDGDAALQVQGTYSGSTITISGNSYTK